MKKYHIKGHEYIGEVFITTSTVSWINRVAVKYPTGYIYLVEPSQLVEIQVVSPTTREIGQRAPISSKMLDCPKAV